MGLQRMCNIMVVDDEEYAREYMQEILQGRGYDTVSFADPLKALEFLSKNGERIDLIVSDILMPTIDGMELAKKAAKISEEIAVILLSGYFEKLIDAAILSNVWAVLAKPVLKTDLVQTVEHVIAARARTRQGCPGHLASVS
jgi:CheY-like chemotaxis protein